MATITTEQQALEAGFVRRFYGETESGFHSTELLVRENVDLDDWFVAYAVDWNETIRVNGCNWILEELDLVDAI